MTGIAKVEGGTPPGFGPTVWVSATVGSKPSVETPDEIFAHPHPSLHLQYSATSNAFGNMNQKLFENSQV